MLHRSLLAVVLLWSAAAGAQNVVILEFTDDKDGALRSQIEDAVDAAGKVQRVALSRFKQVASKKRFKGSKVMSPAAVAAVSGTLSLNAAVTGEVGEKIAVKILDPNGEQLWGRDLPSEDGKLSADNARRLASAIAAAARTTQPAAAEGEEGQGEQEQAEEKPKEQEMSGLDLSGEGTATGTDESAADGTRVPTDEETAADEDEAPRPRRDKAGKPPLAIVQLVGSTSWRHYCGRPGVASCAEYDRAEPNVPPGNPVNFNTEIPYLGFLIAAQVFPLAGMASPLNGIGVVGGFGMGCSRTDVYSVSGSTRVKIGTVVSTERAWDAALAYRYFLELGDRSGAPGYVGLRAGVASHAFEVGQLTSTQNVAHTHRLFPAIRLDASFPLAKYVRLEGSGGVLINSVVSADDFLKYGATASSLGWSAELGASGDLFGPVGYQVLLRMTQYNDRFQGAGTEWTAGGAASETFATVYWGVRAAF